MWSRVAPYVVNMENATDNNIESLLSLNIEQLNKPDLKLKIKDMQDFLRKLYEEKTDSNIQNSVVENILKRLDVLESNETKSSETIKKLQEENKSLRKRVEDLEVTVDDNELRFIDVEKSVLGVEQYSRRENFEIAGIPTNVPQHELKDKVIQIANTICERTQPITASDIHACHRLKEENGQASVIVRMVNREDTVNILKSKKTLPEKSTTDLGYQNKLFINENLCAGTKDIYLIARQLKKDKHVSSCWTFNGVVHVKKRESDQKGKKIFHLADFEKHFTLSQLGWN